MNNYVKFIQKNYFIKPFNFLLIFSIDIITPVISSTETDVTSCVYNMQWLFFSIRSFSVDRGFYWKK